MPKIIGASKIILPLTFVLFMLSSSLIFSQTAVPPYDPDGTVATQQAFFDQANNTTIFDYRVAYFIDTRKTYDDIVSPETIARLTGARIFGTYPEFREYQQSGQPPTQIALIHSSMFKKIDREWSRQAYRDSSVIFAGIDMPYYELGDLVGDNCIKMPDRDDIFSQALHSFFYLSYNTNVDTLLSEGEIAETHHRQLELCKGGRFGEGWGQGRLDAEIDYDALWINLKLQAAYYGMEPVPVDPERTAEATIPG
jgi:hypothetical protein